MPRVSQRETVTESVHAYLAIGEVHSPEEYSLHVRSVAASLHISPTTLYKYRLDEIIVAARERQKQNATSRGKTSEKRAALQTIQDLKVALELERERNRGLVAKIVLMEANAARLGFDPEELYRPIPKPLRSISRAGRSGRQRRV
jgi:hypothetical protein